ncbi:hypothetical protein AGMMS49959_02880 [Planctomycetales bacterium]|nr:hypothetical protein AGMMS49959_02880 [Planctomycetales bacterium]
MTNHFNRIIAHLYGELPAEEENILLTEAAKRSSVRRQIAHWRQLLTAYRLAPPLIPPTVSLPPVKIAVPQSDATPPPIKTPAPLSAPSPAIATADADEISAPENVNAEHRDAAIGLLDRASLEEQSEKLKVESEEASLNSQLSTLNSNRSSAAGTLARVVAAVVLGGLIYWSLSERTQSERTQSERTPPRTQSERTQSENTPVAENAIPATADATLSLTAEIIAPHENVGALAENSVPPPTEIALPPSENINEEIPLIDSTLLAALVGELPPLASAPPLADNFVNEADETSITKNVAAVPLNENQLAMAEPTPSESAQLEPTPSQPAQSEPAQSEPVAVAAIEPTASEPTQLEPTPSESAPSEPMLLISARELYRDGKLMTLLFELDDAAIAQLPAAAQAEAWALKARVELKLNRLQDMKKSIAALRPLNALDAQALNKLRDLALAQANTEAEILPTPLSAASAPRRVAVITAPPSHPAPVAEISEVTPRAANPRFSTDPYDRR